MGVEHARDHPSRCVELLGGDSMASLEQEGDALVFTIGIVLPASENGVSIP